MILILSLELRIDAASLTACFFCVLLFPADFLVVEWVFPEVSIVERVGCLGR